MWIVLAVGAAVLAAVLLFLVTSSETDVADTPLEGILYPGDDDFEWYVSYLKFEDRGIKMAKNFAGDVAREVCWEAVQIHGGMGYMRETRVERLARDARLLHIGGGTREVMNEIIGRFHLGL